MAPPVTGSRESSSVRPMAVAGRFYPGAAARLAAVVDDALQAGARDGAHLPAGRLVALVAPHAGYVYSGLVAGAAYAAITDDDRSRIRRVIVLGPAHYVFLRGLATVSVAALQTPLGEVRVAADLRSQLVDDGLLVDDAPHSPEHSLEVQLPFLQRVLPAAEVLPVLAGLAAESAVAQLLSAVWDDPATLAVISTDLSHYLPLASAWSQDTRTVAAVVAGDAASVADADACGARPLRGLLLAARSHGGVITLLDRATSADAGGPPERVVGYASLAVTTAEPAVGPRS
jgi:AmmeMemoRadiSam system protein B